MTDSISGSGGSKDSRSIGGNGGSLAELNQNFDQFLTLLTTQLKNQDPMDPVDTNEFTNQLVQFASVEQLIKQNEYFEKLIAQQGIATSVAASDFKGKIVEVPGSVATLKDGEANWAYMLEEDANEITIEIKDEDGFVLQTIKGETKKGVHELRWDGEKKDGTDADPGNYIISIEALDAEGKQMFGRVWGHAEVEGVEIGSGEEPYLIVGGNKHPISLVSEIR